MMKKKLSNGRRVSPEMLRSALGDMVDAICSSERPVMIVAGNTFEIHLEDAVVNIAFHERKRRPRKRRKEGEPKIEKRVTQN